MSFTSFESLAIKRHFDEHGFVIVSIDNLNTDELYSLIEQLVIKYPEAKNTGFFDLYHDHTIAEIRQNPTIYKIFSNLWERHDLWVVFDRMIYMTADDAESTLPFHVDQNPWTHPGFHLMQGLLALCDTDENTGMLTLIPGSHKWFHRYKEWSNEKQGWVGYKGIEEIKEYAIPIKLKKGELVIWDSRITHSRVLAVPPIKTRCLAMISYMPVPQENNEQLLQARLNAFNLGIGICNHDAGLRKTGGSNCKSLRVTPESFTNLGKKLYGLLPWGNSN